MFFRMAGRRLLQISFMSSVLIVFWGSPAGAQVWNRPLLPEILSEDDPVSSLNLELLSPVEDLATQVRVVVHRKPIGFDHEFALLVVGGKIRRAFVVSTAKEGKVPILGKFVLDVPRVNGTPWPWRVSIKFDHSPMFWALQINGGYFFHSSPHYGNLGAPASNGCIRASYPDAMEVFDAVVNRSAGRASVIELHEGLRLGSGSSTESALLGLLEQSGWTLSELQLALETSFREVRLVSKGDVEYAPGVPIDGHVRPFGEINEKKQVFPKCGGRDCWEHFRHPRRILRLKPDVIFRNPAVSSFAWTGNVSIMPGSRVFLEGLIPGGVAECDPFLIREVRVRVVASTIAPRIRICDQESGVCSRFRGPAPFASEELVFPLGLISERLRSSAGLYLEVESGEGTVESIEAVYFDY